MRYTDNLYDSVSQLEHTQKSTNQESDSTNNSVYNAVITPSYSEGEGSTCMYDKMLPEELVQIALGKNFTTSTKVTVNATYQDWMNHLVNLMSCGHISRKMMIGFLNLNMYNHKKDGPTDVPETPSDSNTSGKDLRPVCCGKPYIV